MPACPKCTPLSWILGSDGAMGRIGRLALLAVAGLLATALPITNAFADDNGPDTSRTMSGQCTTTFAFTSATTVNLHGTCHLRNLGLTIVSASQSVTPLDNGTLLVTNNAVYTSARGDQLYATAIAIGVPTATGVSFSGTESYRGGTGRFVDALGSVAVFGSATFTSASAGTGEFKTLGVISF